MARVGFVAIGLMHLNLSATAIAVALGKSGEADRAGAIQQLAAQRYDMME